MGRCAVLFHRNRSQPRIQLLQQLRIECRQELVERGVFATAQGSSPKQPHRVGAQVEDHRMRLREPVCLSNTLTALFSILAAYIGPLGLVAMAAG